MLNVAIIEDDKDYRESFKEFFTHQSKTIQCIFAVNSVETFLKYYNNDLDIDIILVDIKLPGVSGIKGVNYLSKLEQDFEIIILTAFDDTPLIFQAITAGATGYLLKNLTFKEIESKILDTVKKGAAISPQIARRIIEYFQPTDSFFNSSAQEKLTEKEMQIIQFVLDGKTYEEIAPLLALSINGLKYHVKKIYKKVQVKSKSGIIKRFLKKMH